MHSQWLDHYPLVHFAAFCSSASHIYIKKDQKNPKKQIQEFTKLHSSQNFWCPQGLWERGAVAVWHSRLTAALMSIIIFLYLLAYLRCNRAPQNDAMSDFKVTWVPRSVQRETTVKNLNVTWNTLIFLLYLFFNFTSECDTERVAASKSFILTSRISICI